MHALKYIKKESHYKTVVIKSLRYSHRHLFILFHKKVCLSF